MMEEEELIQKYIRGELTEDELRQAEIRIKEDKNFAEKIAFEIQLYKTFNDDLWNTVNNTQSEEVLKYKKELKSAEILKLQAEIKKAQQRFYTRKKLKQFIWPAAAILILVISIRLFYKPKVTFQELYTSNLNTGLLPSLVNRNEEANRKLTNAELSFKAKNYKEALTIFKNEIAKPENKNYGILYIYLGIAQLETNNIKQARQTFNTLIMSDMIDAEKGYWYKALLHLKTEEQDSSKLVLTKIYKEKLYNYKQAKTVLKYLEN